MSQTALVNWLKPPPSHLKIRLISFSERVGRLYKLWLRDIHRITSTLPPKLGRLPDPLVFRKEAVRLRSRLDKLIEEKDPKRAQSLLEQMEREYLMKRPPQQYNFAESPGGCAYGRSPPPSDIVVDYWHPMEKMMYPHYFARREQRKREALESALLQYGPPITDDTYWHDHMAGLPPGYSVLIEKGGLDVFEELWGKEGRRHAEEKLGHSVNLRKHIESGGTGEWGTYVDWQAGEPIETALPPRVSPEQMGIPADATTRAAALDRMAKGLTQSDAGFGLPSPQLMGGGEHHSEKAQEESKGPGPVTIERATYGDH